MQWRGDRFRDCWAEPSVLNNHESTTTRSILALCRGSRGGGAGPEGRGGAHGSVADELRPGELVDRCGPTAPRLPGASPEIAERAGPVLVAGAHSAVDIVYPQLGGLTSERASVMAVVSQRLLLQEGQRQTVVRTIDVRLVRREGRWSVEDIPSFGGDPVPTPVTLLPSAARVLTHPAIDLPDSARWDILTGRVGEPILALLAELADRHRLGVTVFATGHPHEVFGTTRISNHTRGAAVDLWFVDAPVVGQRDPRGALAGLVSDLLKTRGY